MDYSKLDADTEFDIVLELAQNDGVGHVLTIPGVWEIVREYYNNSTLEVFERRFMDTEES
jgi:hypothetical protein